MEILYITLRTVHVLGAVFWAGATFLLLFFLEPAARDSGPAGREVLGNMVRRGYSGFVANVALVTILTGFWLIWRMSGHFSPAFMGSTAGMLLSVGMLTGVLALGTGVHMVRRPTRKLAELGGRIATAGAAPTPEELAELTRLQDKIRTSIRITAVLLLITVVTMALGPHV